MAEPTASDLRPEKVVEEKATADSRAKKIKDIEKRGKKVWTRKKKSAHAPVHGVVGKK